LIRPFAAFLAFMSLAAPSWAGGDRVTLKSGQVYSGDLLFHDAGTYVLATPGGTVRLALSDIQKIEFGPTTPSTPSTRSSLE
jgi:hypothetical protein